MKCQRCGAALPVGVDVCQHCKTLNDTDFRQLGQAQIATGGSVDECQCPRCHSPLVFLKIQMGEVYPVHRCKKCLGTFFSSDDLRQLVNSVADGKAMDKARIAQLCKETPKEIWPITYIPCPTCRQTMMRSGYRGNATIMTDVCRDHGVWLDGGELGRILNWARAGGV